MLESMKISPITLKLGKIYPFGDELTSIPKYKAVFNEFDVSFHRFSKVRNVYKDDNSFRHISQAFQSEQLSDSKGTAILERLILSLSFKHTRLPHRWNICVL